MEFNFFPRNNGHATCFHFTSMERFREKKREREQRLKDEPDGIPNMQFNVSSFPCYAENGKGYSWLDSFSTRIRTRCHKQSNRYNRLTIYQSIDRLIVLLSSPTGLLSRSMSFAFKHTVSLMHTTQDVKQLMDGTVASVVVISLHTKGRCRNRDCVSFVKQSRLHRTDKTPGGINTSRHLAPFILWTRYTMYSECIRFSIDRYVVYNHDLTIQSIAS